MVAPPPLEEVGVELLEVKDDMNCILLIAMLIYK